MKLGANLVAIAGAAMIGYGILFVIRNFTGYTELGLTPELCGGTPEQIAAFSPRLATVGHLGPIYLTEAILLAGTVLAHTSLKKGA